MTSRPRNVTLVVGLALVALVAGAAACVVAALLLVDTLG
jgi:hypothetical protein